MSADQIEAAMLIVFDGRAGVFARFAIASAAYAIAAQLWRRWLPAPWTTWAHVGASVVLLAALATPLVTTALVAHAVLLFVASEGLRPGPVRRALLGALLVAHAAMPVLWFPSFPGYTLPVREFVAFATNAGLLRACAWVRDRPRLQARGAALARDYALYTFFLPCFANGPFFAPSELHRRRLPSAREIEATRTTSSPVTGHALRRVLVGLAAAALAVPLFDVFSADAYRRAATGSMVSGWGHAAGIYVCFYLGFTAWTEAGIGFAALAGIRLPENFDAPHRSYGLADFWRRWNVTLGRWMLQYVYLPLAPRGPTSRAFGWYGTAIVFASVAAYHYLGGLKLFGPAIARLPGFWIPWLAWAVLNTVGVRLTQTWRAPRRTTPLSLAVNAATLAAAAIGMLIVFFPVELPLGLLRETLRRMATPLHG